MKLETFYFTQSQGWSVPAFPQLDSPQTLVIVFGSPMFGTQENPFEALQRAYPNAYFLGCSTSGEIFQTEIRDQSLSVAVMQFEWTELQLATTPVNDSDNSYLAGCNLAKKLVADEMPQNVFVLSDGVQVNGSELVRGLNSHLPSSVVVTGGLAGDGDRFGSTWVLRDGKPVEGWITAVGFYGDRIKIGHGSKGGWDIFGPERLVTRSKNNVLYELDGKPALALYKEYLGERAEDLPASALLFPLALRKNETDNKQIVRTILGVDEISQSMTFAGDIPEGYLAQLMKANFDRLIDGASTAAQMTLDSSPANNQTPILSIAISCVGRRLVMGELTEEELEATLDILPKHVQQIGFYSYGEISPYTTGFCDLHNQTMTLTTIYEV